MFNDLSKSTTSGNAVDDIFAETDAAARPNPNSQVNIEAQPAGLSASGYNGSDNEQGAGNSKAKIKFILILFLAVVILAAAAYLVYAKITRNASELADNNIQLNNTNISEKNPVKTVDSTNNIGSVVAPEIEVPEVATTTVEVPPIQSNQDMPVATETPAIIVPVDSDGDSLTDAEEITAGTNINLIDSDFDGLSDYEELRVYNTNPLNPDTDGDGYSDGDEVKNGYNPKGAGKL